MQHQAFARVRESLRLSLPDTEIPVAHEFHFHMVGGIWNRTTSLGHVHPQRNADDDADIARCVAEIVLGVGNIDAALPIIINMLGERDLRDWAFWHIRREGQVLSNRPSRLEKCLIVQAALDFEPKWQLGEKAKKELVAAQSQRVTCFKVDNYLGRADGLLLAFAKSAELLGATEVAELISPELKPSSETAAFLAAEVLQFWRATETAEEFLARRTLESPGIAILPFRVLGQYRAAGVWFYEGAFDPAGQLARHLAEMCVATRWLEPFFDLAMLSQTRQALIDAVHRTAGQDLGRCKNLHDALRGLWFPKSITFLHPKNTPGNLECAETVLHALPKACETIKLEIEGDAAELLGFNELEYQCPVSPDRQEFERAAANAQEMLQDVKLAAKNVQSLIRSQAKEKAVAQISATAHDIVNGLNPIIMLSAPESTRKPNAETRRRLDIVHALSQQLEGAAWAMHGWVRGEGKRMEIAFSSDEPNLEDLLFWQQSLRMHTLVSFASWRLSAPPIAQSVLRLHLSFGVRDYTGATSFEPWSEDFTFTHTDSPAVDIRPPADRTHAPWPLAVGPLERQSKFGVSGRINVFCNGPVELVRNAARYVCEYQHTHALDWTVTVDAKFHRTRRGWKFVTIVTNPVDLPTQKTSHLTEIRSWQRIREALDGRAEFRQLASGDDMNSCAYILRMS